MRPAVAGRTALTYSVRPSPRVESLVPNSANKPEILIRDLDSIADLQLALDLEKLTWEAADQDVTPLALAIATRAAGAMWIGAFGLLMKLVK